MIELLTFSLIAMIVVFAFGLKSGKYKSNRYTWTKKDSEKLKSAIEASRKHNEKLCREMEIRKEERRNNVVVPEEIKKIREKTWDYYDIG